VHGSGTSMGWVGSMTFTARCYAERGRARLSRLSVCPSVTFRYRDHIGWNSSKIISRPNSLRYLLTLTPAWAILRNGNTPKLGWNRGGVSSTKNLQYLRNGARQDQGYYYRQSKSSHHTLLCVFIKIDQFWKKFVHWQTLCAICNKI